MINTVKKMANNKFFVPIVLLALVLSVITIKLFAVDFEYWLQWLSFIFIFVCIMLPFEKCLGIFLFLLPFRGFYNPKWFCVSFYIFLGIFIIKLVCKIVKKEKRLQLVPLILSLVLIVTCLYNYDYAELSRLMYSIGLIILTYLTFSNLTEINKFNLIKFFVAGILTSAAIGGIFAQFSVLRPYVFTGADRFQALSSQANTFQMFCGTAIACMLYAFLKNHVNIIQFATISFFLIGVGMLTKSKAFLICVGLLTLIFLITMFLKNKKIFAFSLFIICIMTFVFMDEMIVIIDRFFISKHTNIWDKIFTGRYSIWKGYVEECSSSIKLILFGRGVCAPEFGGHGAHNTFIEAWYRHGVVGLMLIAALIISYFVKRDNKIKVDWFAYIPLVTTLLLALEESMLPDLGVMYVLAGMLVFEKFKGETVFMEDKQKIQTDDNIKISVIVPIYKVEKYLKRGIDSILNQTYHNLEIILVDDGSPDNCPKICDEYAKLDKRIKVVHKQNGGLSDARNAGLEVATGDFISFIDSDDYIDETMYEKMINSQEETKSQIVMCGFKHVFEDNNNEEKIIYEENLIKLEKEEIYPYLLNVGYKKTNGGLKTQNIMGCVWRLLYSKDIIGSSKFIKGMICEDLPFIIEIFNKKPKVSVVDEPLYNYVQRGTSIVHSFNEEKIKKRIEAYKIICEKLEGKVDEKALLAYKFHLSASIINELIKNNQMDKVENILTLDFMQSLNSKENYMLAKKSTNSLKYKIAYWFIYKKKYKTYSLLLKII